MTKQEKLNYEKRFAAWERKQRVAKTIAKLNRTEVIK